MTASMYASMTSGASAAAGGASPAAALTLSGTLAAGGIDPVRVGLSFAVCIALGIAAILLLRRRLLGRQGIGLLQGVRSASAGKRLTVAETARLDARTTLYLVDCDGRTVLLAADATGVKQLDARTRAASEPAA
ncbi:hypothetical protein FAZ69_10995 [Trinickia terrae]|uniref:Flagellar biosynthetic protein FliO n=1 Tax=Trinickia terrae TaxID=2571161 RepID=A0A4U1I7Q1_9BURK|nr:flagellar biosynthetic protein FliO [Trinickia terrae]TKC89452.1 hypothetical protein FAZ69_10995 [Trinickia terrae]